MTNEFNHGGMNKYPLFIFSRFRKLLGQLHNGKTYIPMNSVFIFFLILWFLYPELVLSQDKSEIVWWNPANEDVIEGQGWSDGLFSPYGRLPERAENLVRKPLWNLSENSAGLVVRFQSNANIIYVRYQVSGEFAFPHMPATGVSGVDLYSKNRAGDWIWSKGNYSFGDTVQYSFVNTISDTLNTDSSLDFYLYMPLYNRVKWLEVGVPAEMSLAGLPARTNKPVVIYGTSIVQGACASRPGMAWPAILGRILDMPVANLGFSGNGLLEPELIDLMNEIDASVYILDCLPNLGPNSGISSGEILNRIIASVTALKQKHPLVPVLLIDHSGYSDGSTNMDRKKIYTDLNLINHKAFDRLRAEGVEELYLIPKKNIGLTIDSYVDGTHPSDLGMMQYAEAVNKYLREILDRKVE